ncbi:MAG TPA: hypothetical protein DD706_21035 [Nitrospiraceae bacterium]|nr:hypothetical protein [Nitrospiraceae bacterium]
MGVSLEKASVASSREMLPSLHRVYLFGLDHWSIGILRLNDWIETALEAAQIHSWLLKSLPPNLGSQFPHESIGLSKDRERLTEPALC